MPRTSNLEPCYTVHRTRQGGFIELRFGHDPGGVEELETVTAEVAPAPDDRITTVLSSA